MYTARVLHFGHNYFITWAQSFNTASKLLSHQLKRSYRIVSWMTT